ncbi:biotin/lipoyl-containing protein [Candidatus Palauibacter sp.]|uniref:biotin/lipoyl-containing protein n=1 Tax=Candidatus Palauibacter sp. TaxID=3101350 RepID=UPI003AF25F6C
MKYHAGVEGESFEVERLASGLRINGFDREAELIRVGDGELRLILDGRNHRVFARPTPKGWRVTVRGRTFEVAVEDERARALRALASRSADGTGAREVRAPMPGLISRVLVRPGQRVAGGEALVVVEAMKMENELRSEGSATVAEIRVGPGDIVDRDDVLVTLEPEKP